MMSLVEIAQAVQGKLIGENLDVMAVEIDSRTLSSQSLFVAIQGKKFDGHTFVNNAIQNGAISVLVETAYADSYHGDFPIIVVKNSLLALGELARYWRKKREIPIVAITGSSGKTTTKSMIACVLSHAFGQKNVFSTRGNLNNEIGLPLSILQIRDQHQYGVLELGMNHLGEIRYLTQIAQPDVALITNSGTAHIEHLKTEENIAIAKGEILEGLRKNGIAVLNKEEKFFSYWKGCLEEQDLLTFGVGSDADVYVESYQLQSHGTVLTVSALGEQCPFQIHCPGWHNVSNAIASVSVCMALGLKMQDIATGLSLFEGVAGRLQIKKGLHGSSLIDDTYNANPNSTKAAISVLANYGGKRILVLGDMAELGGRAQEMHATIGKFAKKQGIHHLFALGEFAEDMVRAFGGDGRLFDDQNKLIQQLQNVLDSDTTVLVKGSRFMAMEKIVLAIEDTKNVT